MRQAWRRGACVAIGLSGAVFAIVPVAASEFHAVVISAVPQVKPGAGVAAPVRRSTHLRALPTVFPGLDDASSADPHMATFSLPTVRTPGSGSKLAQVSDGVRMRQSRVADLYTHGDSGLRASVAARYQAGYSPSDTGPDAPAGTAATMQMPGGSFNLRDGYERYAPAAMAGYDQRINDRLKVGVEGGMMLGRAAGNYTLSENPESRTASNPVADMTMTYAF